MKLTQTRIAGLKCPPEKRDMLVFDDEQRGLGVRVLASGGKTFLAQYTWHGQKRRIPLGSSSAVSLGKVRDAVRAIMGDVAKGVDPAAVRKKAAAEARRNAAHEALTLAALLSDWQALHLAGKRPSYAAEAVRALRNAFSRYLDLPAADLDRATAVKTLDAMARKGSVAMAARTAAYGKAAYGWAAKRGALSVNPFLNLPVAPAPRRERVLSDNELAAVWRATVGPGPFNGIVRFPSREAALALSGSTSAMTSLKRSAPRWRLGRRTSWPPLRGGLTLATSSPCRNALEDLAPNRSAVSFPQHLCALFGAFKCL